jgi:hypothetical protein
VLAGVAAGDVVRPGRPAPATSRACGSHAPSCCPRHHLPFAVMPAASHIRSPLAAPAAPAPLAEHSTNCRIAFDAISDAFITGDQADRMIRKSLPRPGLTITNTT